MIDVRGLTKNYGDVHAVKGIGFSVSAGEVFGLLGPNGAGKTTTVEILEGLRPRTGGEVRVLGLDPGSHSAPLKDRIGVCLQLANLADRIKVREAMALFAAFYFYTRTVDGEALLKRLQLWEKRDAYYMHLSGGQKQRLALALALINDPQLLFLDEPSTGLDPQARLEIRSLLGELKQERRTILLTTHYIEEAERLCDRVAIIDEGRIAAIGTPREIQEKTLGHSTVEFDLETPLAAADLPDFRHSVQQSLSPDRRRLTVLSSKPAATLVDLVKWLDEQSVEIADVHLKRPSLEEAFIELTGKSLRD
ncbi:MAG: ABC transporter ATP-binding protein [Bryobacteraceae bacterium]